MPLPTTPCPNCGVPYFPQAMRFHAPKCVIKRMRALHPCPGCGMQLRADELSLHMRKCALAAPPATRRAPAGQSAAEQRPTMEILPTAEDGRVPCAVCGRKFAPDRIAKHQYICSRIGVAKPAARPRTSPLEHRRGRPGPRQELVGQTMGGPMCSSPPWVSDFADGVSPLDSPPRPLPGLSKSKARAVMMAPSRSPASQNGVYENATSLALPRRSWKSQSEELRAAMRAARGLPPKATDGSSYGRTSVTSGVHKSGVADDGLLPCPHCERTFSALAWERHVPGCKRTINRPKPPPRVDAHSHPSRHLSPSAARPSTSGGYDRQHFLRTQPYGVVDTRSNRNALVAGRGGRLARTMGATDVFGIGMSPRTSLENPLSSIHRQEGLFRPSTAGSCDARVHGRSSRQSDHTTSSSPSFYGHDVATTSRTSWDNPLSVMCRPEDTFRPPTTGSHGAQPRRGEPSDHVHRTSSSPTFYGHDVAITGRTSQQNSLSAMCRPQDLYHAPAVARFNKPAAAHRARVVRAPSIRTGPSSPVILSQTTRVEKSSSY